jgi:hypothetical protein
MPTMVNLRRRLVVPVVVICTVICLAGCSDDDGAGGGNDSTEVATTASVSQSVGPTATDVPIAGDFVEILVNADDTAAYGQVEQVPLGFTVVLALRSDMDREYHVHGYDLEQRTPAGTEQVFEFTADQAGEFEVEDHVSGDVLRVLEVG